MTEHARDPLAELYTPLEPLTPEQAERVGRFFDIEVYVGVHGQGMNGEESDPLSAPTELEYDQAASVVERLRLGDILFVEGDASGGHVESMWSKPIDTRNPAAALMQVIMEQSVRRQLLETERQAQAISAWGYARGLAVAKGLTVVTADHSAHKAQAVLEACGGKDVAELWRGSREERAMAGRIYNDRSRTAIGTVQYQALRDSTGRAKVPPPAEDKPKLVLLFGDGHLQELKDAAQEAKLPAKFYNLETSIRKRFVLPAGAFNHLRGNLVIQTLDDGNATLKDARSHVRDE